MLDIGSMFSTRKNNAWNKNYDISISAYLILIQHECDNSSASQNL